MPQKQSQPSELRIGISGWKYEPWRGPFYPKGLRQADELRYASRQLNFNEINGTFYSLQKPTSFQTWYDETPDDFVFAVKGVQFITHIKRLKNVDTPLANFFASGVLALGEKLGPILWQIHPTSKFDSAVLDSFLSLLPQNGKEAISLGKKHDDHLKADPFLKFDPKRRIRHAIEVRNESFKSPEFIKLLRKHGVALVFADAASDWPVMHDLTADFCYLRLHGAEEMYKSGYSDKDIARWANRIKQWRAGKQPKEDVTLVGPKVDGSVKSRDIFLTFDNTFKTQAPANATRLSEKLGLLAGDARATKIKSTEKG